MPDAAQTGLLPAQDVVRSTPLATAANGLRYASFGYTEVPADSLKQIVEAVPTGVANALSSRAYYFVPLAIGETEETEIARGFTLDLGDRATCHRNVLADGVECTFISARLMQDRFALAFEFFINIGHQLVDTAGVPRLFQSLIWTQARTEVRGETSQDAYEARARALESRAAAGSGRAEPALNGAASDHGSSFAEVLKDAEPVGLPGSGNHTDGSRDRTTAISLFASRGSQPARFNQAGLRAEASRTDAIRSADAHSETEHPSEDQVAYFEAAFADTLAIYMLSLAMDLDYADLREREYPLLAASALADRLRLTAELYPPAQGYEFNIRYRRRH